MTDISIGRRAALKDLRPQATTHPGLWLDRYLERQTWRHDDHPPGYDKDQARAAKDKLIQSVTQKQLALGYTHAFHAWRTGLENQKRRVVFAEGQCLGRVIIGLGAKGAGEFGISLHHTWGVPFLPGSSLKGIAALGADRYLDGPQWKRRPASHQARPSGPTAFDALFGDVEEQGAVIFHDAWLVPPGDQKNGLHQDVLTVHHPHYYQGDAEPSDTENPVPVPFVSASGTFLVALELHPSLDFVEHGHWLEAAWMALQAGLVEHGVGSKTNAGYGRVELPAWADTNVAQVQKDIEAERRAAAQAQEQRRRQDERPRMAPLDRADDVLRHEGPDEMVRWLKGGGETSIAGLSTEPEQIKAIVTVLCRARRSKGLLKRSADAWRPLVQTAIDDEWKRSKGGEAACGETKTSLGRRALRAGELDALVEKCRHKKKGIDFNKLARALAGLGLDDDSLDQAETELRLLGAKGGHIKVLLGRS